MSVSKINDISINIARMYFPVKTLGPGERLGIWLAGCERDCSGCISPDFKSANAGRSIKVSNLMNMIKIYVPGGAGITISGGEPFLQVEGLCELMKGLQGFTDDIIIFTGYLYEELIEKDDENIRDILSKTGMLVDGPYIEELNDGKGMRGSSNQRFIILNHPELYDFPEKWERKIQGVVYDNKIISIGIPNKI